jgi:hypothetical protein
MVAACCALAAVLNLGLTKFDTRFSVTYCDYHEELKRGPATAAIIPLANSIADTMCMNLKPGSDKSRQPAAFVEDYGVFARDHVPQSLALGLGIIAPFILLLSAGYLSLQHASQRIRRTVSIMLLIPGLAFTMVICFLVVQALRFNITISEMTDDTALPALAAVLVLAITCMTGGIWLWLPRSSKEPV